MCDAHGRMWRKIGTLKTVMLRGVTGAALSIKRAVCVSVITVASVVVAADWQKLELCIVDLHAVALIVAARIESSSAWLLRLNKVLYMLLVFTFSVRLHEKDLVLEFDLSLEWSCTLQEQDMPQTSHFPIDLSQIRYQSNSQRKNPKL